MFGKKQKKSQSFSSARNRQPARASNESFRRNAVVISNSQKEVAARQQSVTQRQIELKKKVARHQKRLRLGVMVVLALVALLGWRMGLSTVSLDSNASTRLSTEQKTLYEATILNSYKSHAIAGQWWLADTDGLQADLLRQFPEIERISFSSNAPLGTSLKADVRFRKAVFSWRDASHTEQLVDKNGVLFSKNLDPSVHTSKLIKIEDQSGVILESGSPVLTASLVELIGSLYSKVPLLYGKDAKASRVIIPTSTREVQIQVAGQPYLLKFSSTRELDQQIGELNSLLAFLKNKNITPSQYIDIRLEHKAFYK